MPAAVDWCGPSPFSGGGSWPQGGMWTAMIIMANPLAQDGAQMFLPKWNHEVQTLPPHRSNQSLAIGIGLRCSDWCSQNFEAQVFNRLIHFLREDAVPVMD